MRHSILYIALFLVLLVVGCGSKDKKDDKAPQGPQPPLSVEAVIAIMEFTEDILTSTGTVLANQEVEIQSEIPGKITGIHFSEGSNVGKGQVLIKLDDAELRAQLQRLIIEKNLLEEKEYRQRKLLEIQAISKEEYEISLSDLRAANANIAMQQAQIARTVIRAPFSGTIGLKNVSLGATVSPTTVIASLQNITPVKIDFAVPEKYNARIKRGTKAYFTLEGNPRTFRAEVFAIEPKIDLASRTLKIRALSPNKDRSILPGSFANVQMLLGGTTKAILIPTEALVPDLKGAKVFVKKGNKAVPKEVQTGLRTEKHIRILSGLEEGDTVITNGILQLKPGAPVKVVKINVIRPAELTENIQ